MSGSARRTREVYELDAAVRALEEALAWRKLSRAKRRLYQGMLREAKRQQSQAVSRAWRSVAMRTRLVS
jgi:ribosomal protein S21